MTNNRVTEKLDPETPLIISRLSLAQSGNAFGCGLAVCPRLPNRLDKLVDNVRRRRHIGISHAEIDNIGTLCPRQPLQPVHFLKHIRGESFYAMKFFCHGRFRLCL